MAADRHDLLLYWTEVCDTVLILLLLADGSFAALDLVNNSDSEEVRRPLFDRADAQKYNTLNFDKYLQLGLYRDLNEIFFVVTHFEHC